MRSLVGLLAVAVLLLSGPGAASSGDDRSGKVVPREPGSGGRDSVPARVTFPFRFTLTKDKAIVFQGQALLEGETAVFDYDEDRQELTLNGETWTSYAPPAPRTKTGINKWVEDFRRAYGSLQEGTTRERAFQALARVDQAPLDNSCPPVVTDNYVIVHLGRSHSEFFVDLTSPVPADTMSSVDRARSMVSLYSRWFADPNMKVVIIRTRGGEIGHFGEDAKAAVDLMHLAQSGVPLNQEQLALSRRLDLQSCLDPGEGHARLEKEASDLVTVVRRLALDENSAPARRAILDTVIPILLASIAQDTESVALRSLLADTYVLKGITYVRSDPTEDDLAQSMRHFREAAEAYLAAARQAESAEEQTRLLDAAGQMYDFAGDHERAVRYKDKSRRSIILGPRRR